MAELTRRDRLTAVARLDELSAEIATIGGWLDGFGQDADKGSVLCECAARDLLAAAWVIKPADHELPEGHLDGSRAMRGLRADDTAGMGRTVPCSQGADLGR